MKPLKLSMSAFGPYAVKQELNFKELEHRSIFLIHGPTGAGKTTILDAICFALYGDASGEERSSKNMRSHHASVDQLTEVGFEFELKGQVYGIKRIPEQERLKKTGDGTTTQLQEALLYKYNGTEEKLIQTGWKGVTEEVEKLLGFRSSQFRQVIMLPQGEFRKLLMADSLERQGILEKLFNTENYKKIEELLKESAKKLKDSFKDLENQKNWLLQKSDCENAEELERLIEEHEKLLVEVTKELKSKAELVKSAQEAVSKGKADNLSLKEKKTSQEELISLKKLLPSIELKRKELNWARRAATLEEAEESTRIRREDLDRIEKELEEKRKKYSEYNNNQIEAKKHLELEESKEKERALAQKRIIELEGYLGKVQSMESLWKKVEELAQNLENIKKKNELVQKSLTKLDENIEGKIKIVEEIRANSIKLPIYQARYQEKEKAYNKKLKMDNLNSQLVKVQAEETKAELSFRRLEVQYLDSKEELSQLQESWNKGQAAVLGNNLEAGKPCPVCGSTEHPRIAVKVEEIPTEDELKNMKLTVEAFEKEKDRSKDFLNRQQLQREKLENEIMTITIEITEILDLDLQTVKKQMEEEKFILERTLKEVEKLEQLEKELKKLKEQQVNEKSILEKLEEEYTSISNLYLNSRGDLAGREADIPEDLRSLKNLERALEQSVNVLELLNKRYITAKKVYDQLNNELIAAQTGREEATKAWEGAKVKYTLEREKFKQRFLDAGFERYKDYENAKRNENEIIILEREMQDFEGRLVSKEDRFKRACKAAEGIVEPNMERLQASLESVERDRDEAIKLENSLIQKIVLEKSTLKDILIVNKEIVSKEKEYETVGYLSQISNGANAFGLTFQRFVLGALLDDITVAATQRLKRMSKGRYHLRRTLDRARKNAAGGLELEVFDTYTGIERPVSTLSGGETFLASLSLALGLADVVQSYSGGISLDTIFVDEGFGSLDPEALDLALKTLIDLQKGGRLVGIISHVPELKERIDARLEIAMSDLGSTATFKIS